MYSPIHALLDSNVPQLDGKILAAGGEGGGVEPNDVLDGPLMSILGDDLLVVVDCVPDNDLAVGPNSGKVLVVGTPGNGLDTGVVVHPAASSHNGNLVGPDFDLGQNVRTRAREECERRGPRDWRRWRRGGVHHGSTPQT